MNRRSFHSFITSKFSSLVSEDTYPIAAPPRDFNGYFPVGGYLPPTPGTVSEAAEDETTYSKTPILFNREDVFYLWQFPPALQKQALSLRYNQLLLSSKQKQERGEEVPGTQDILIPGRKGAIYRFKNIKHESGRLIERLEKKRDLKALRNLDPTKASEYKGGLHEYDLSGVHRDEETGQLVAKGFIGLTEGTAGSIFNEWRDGITPGWLGKPKNGATFRPVGFGGGKPKTGITLDWNGNPLVHGKEGIQMPIWGRDALLRGGFDASDPPIFKPEDVNENGEVSHSFETLRPPRGLDDDGMDQWRKKIIADFYDGKGIPEGWTPEKTAPSPMPMFRPGGLVTASAYHEYNKLVSNLQPLYDPNTRKWTSTSEAQNVIDHALKLLPDSGAPEAAKRFGELDYVLGRFNKDTAAVQGNAIKLGGNQNLKNAKEQIPGTQEDRNFLQKHFIYSKFDANGRWSTLDALDRPQTRSAVAEGINSALFRIKGTNNYYVLNMFLDELKQEAGMSILKLAGDPLYTELIEAKKNNDPKATSLFEQVWRKIKQRAQTYATEISQFDWGQGTRRKLRSRGEQSADTVGDDTGRDAYGITKMGHQDDAGYTMARPDAGVNPLSVTARASGQRTGIRAKGGKYATNAAGNMFQSGHSPAAIMAEIKRRAAQRDQIIASGVDSWDQQTSQNSLRQDIEAASELFGDYVDQYMSNQGAGKTPEEKAEIQKAADAWADNKTREALKANNIKVSTGLSAEDVPQKAPKVTTPPQLRKYATRWASDNKPDEPDVQMPGVETLLQMNPKDLPGHVASDAFIDHLRSNPNELQKAKTVAAKLQSRALFAAIAKAETGGTVSIPKPKPIVAPQDDDEDDYTQYRSTRGR